MKHLILLVVAVLTEPLFAQENIREEVYIHSNSQTLITGETLSLSAFCRSATSGMPSRLSKYIYVELVGTDGAIFQEKWKLKKGRGYGEFFVSSNIKTGTYHLIAYTRWMRNFGEYFSAKVEIINPFEEFEADAAEEIQLNITPANGSVVEGIENTLGLMVKGNKSQKFTGRVVDGSGKVEGSFELDKWGIGLVKFTPEADRSYQIIIENLNGEFSFFPVPASASSGYSLQVYPDSNHLAIDLHMAKFPDSNFQLRIKNGKEIIYTDHLKAGAELKIPLSQLYYKGNSPLQIIVLDEFNKILASRTISLPSKTIQKRYAEILPGTRQTQGLELGLPDGSYSVSIRRLDKTFSPGRSVLDYKWAAELESLEGFDLLSYMAANENQIIEAAWIMTSWKDPSTTSIIKLLPEVREEILSGVLLSDTDEPVSQRYVAISLFQEPYQLRVAQTSEDGRFVMPYQSTEESVDAYIYPIDADSSYQIKLESPFLENYPAFNYDLPEPDTLQIKQLIDRSIRVQIENAFFKPKVTSEKIPDSWLPQFRFDFVYKLDDYTRFKTLKETFTEYIVTANVRDKRSPLIKAYFLSSSSGKENQPLILLDGVIVSPGKLIDFSPYEIESISVQNSRNYLGSLISDGVVSFISKDGKLGGFAPGYSYMLLKISGTRQLEIIHTPSYLSSSQSKLPDQRDQIYWNPLLEVAGNESSLINFFTSDLSGQFRVIINGFEKDGSPLSREIDFEVLDHH